MTGADQPILLTYKYRLNPTRAQHRALEMILEQQRQLYNAALAERIDCYAKTGVGITEAAQSRSLTVIRADDPALGCPSAVLLRYSPTGAGSRDHIKHLLIACQPRRVCSLGRSARPLRSLSLHLVFEFYRPGPPSMDHHMHVRRSCWLHP